jgi:GNAT superfamily N-acetyltransferase
MIRLFTPIDEEACRRIITRCFDLSVVLGEREKEIVKRIYTTEGYFRSKARKYPLFVFDESGMILGLGGIDGNEIKKLYVEPNCQRRGIGKILLAHLEQIAISEGHKRLVLYCFDNSIEFYKNRGYKIMNPHFIERGGEVKIPTTMMEKQV